MPVLVAGRGRKVVHKQREKKLVETVAAAKGRSRWWCRCRWWLWW